MRRALHPLFVMLASLTQQELARQIAYLKKENEILRARLPERIHTTKAERKKLLKAGRKIGPKLRELMSIVKYESFLRWVREKEQGSTKKTNVGRPKVAEDIQKLVLRLHEETGDGYTLLEGRLKRLGYNISRSTIRNILKAAGHDPQPRRDADSWDAFLQRHADVMWQCDFLVKPQWAITGMKDLFQLLFIHIGTRRIWISPATNNPDANWMSEQARSFLQHCEDVELKHTIVMRDNDGKFQKGFDEVLEAGKCYVKKNTPKSPNLNAFVERAVQTYEHECLDQFIVISPRQLNVIGREFQAWYNYERPHSSVNHLPPGDQTMPIVGNRDTEKDVICETRLGGLLKNYTRRAA